MGRTVLAICNELADALGWQQLTTVEGDLSPYARKLVRTLNRVVRTLSSLDDFFFLRSEGFITTIEPYQTGIVATNNGVMIVAGLDDPDTTAVDPPVWTTAMEGRAIQIGTDSLVYRIVTVNSPISLTLDRAYQGETTTGSNYTIAQDRYELAADFDRPIGDWTNFFGSSTTKLKPLSPNEFLDLRRNQAGMLLAEPSHFTAWGYDDETEHRLIILHPFPAHQRVLQYPYQKTHPVMETDTDKVLFPLRYEPVLIDACIYLLKRDIEDDQSAGAMLIDFLNNANNIMAKREYGAESKRISPSGLHRIRQYQKWGSRTRKVDYGEHFDNIDFYNLK